ncbi:MAG: hypothetical protein RIQ81_315 [Pseudomonadota bacterium]
MHRYFENQAMGLGIKSLRAGLTLTQRAGLTPNLNPYLHVLMVDDAFTELGGTGLFRTLPAMTYADVSTLAEAIVKK